MSLSLVIIPKKKVSDFGIREQLKFRPLSYPCIPDLNPPFLNLLFYLFHLFTSSLFIIYFFFFFFLSPPPPPNIIYVDIMTKEKV